MFFTENMMIFVYICQSNDKYHDNKIDTEKITKISKIQNFLSNLKSIKIFFFKLQVEPQKLLVPSPSEQQRTRLKLSNNTLSVHLLTPQNTFPSPSPKIQDWTQSEPSPKLRPAKLLRKITLLVSPITIQEGSIFSSIKPKNDEIVC